MGSYSHLRIGRLNLDWSKNSLDDHSCLFSAKDLTLSDYHYAEGIIERHPAYSRKLYMLRDRLHLMGYENQNNIFEEVDSIITYKKLITLLKKIDIEISVYDEKELDSIFHMRFNDLTIKILTLLQREENMPDEDLLKIGQQIDEIDPYKLMTIFIENNLFTDQNIVWEFYDIVAGG